MTKDDVFHIRTAEPRDDAARGALLAGPYHEDADKLAAELVVVRTDYSDCGVLDPALIAWVAVDMADTVIGVLEAGMRLSANGCETLGVLFVEGIAIDPDWHRRGVGNALLQTAEAWARTRGITEMASDVETDNALSRQWHEAMGFTPREEVICYRKIIG